MWVCVYDTEISRGEGWAGDGRGGWEKGVDMLPHKTPFQSEVGRIYPAYSWNLHSCLVHPYLANDVYLIQFCLFVCVLLVERLSPI